MFYAVMKNMPAVGAGRPRLEREYATLAAMLSLYCRRHHSAVGGQVLCAECLALRDYAGRRLARCPFGEDKPSCAKCSVHCYSATMRERVRRVMRWAGPRMLLHHPLMALRHALAGRRGA